MQENLNVGYFDEDVCSLEDFKALTQQNCQMGDVPHAHDVIKNVPIYDVAQMGDDLLGSKRRAILAEWARVLRGGAGVFVLKNAYADTGVIDQATDVYNQIIADEKANAGGGADHFAAAGNNDRIWNSLQKLCFAAPEIYAKYFGNVAVSAASEAWLGPNYQMTAQINLVRPGGKAQLAHRDYHLGFQTADVSASYPALVHDLSPALTLQGGIAHCDMPIESGPTKLLPFSQAYAPGYAAWRRDDFRAYFEEAYVQLPLAKGDAIFFSPALFHGAGDNVHESIQRMVNLLQVSSAFGRAMESVDRLGMCKALYSTLKDMTAGAERDAAIAATAEGYSFPTNLDRDPPSGGLAPETQAALMQRALGEGWDTAQFIAAVDEQAVRQKP